MDTSLAFWVSMPTIRLIVMQAAKTQQELSTICQMGNISVEDLKTYRQEASSG